MEARLLQAAERGQIATVVKLLRVLVNPNARDDSSYVSALSNACKGGHYEVAKLLIGSGADVNVLDSNLLTPLHLAVKGNHMDTAKLLILNGAKLDAKNGSELRPMDLVAYNSPIWTVLREAQLGMMPEIEEFSEVPLIPDFALDPSATTKKKKKKTGKKKGKGKKGKKKGKKKKK